MSRRSRFLTLTLAMSLLVASASAQVDGVADLPALEARAAAGDAGAQWTLGAMYDYGRGAARDPVQAMRWYRLSAEQGYADAQNSVGSLLQEARRFDEALPWYLKAAAQRHPQAINSLGYLHDLGLGVPQDRNKGFELYRQSAELGWSEAMWNLANMYGAGQLGQPDLLMACVWSARAGRFARPSQKDILAHVERVMPILEKSLPADQLASCRQQAGAWSPAGPVQAGQW